MLRGVSDSYDMSMECLEVFYCYMENEERDEEKCRELRQSLQVIVKEMDAEKAFYIHLLDKTIATTGRLYHYAVSVLQRAIEVKDDEMARITTHFVSTVYNDNAITYKK